MIKPLISKFELGDSSLKKILLARFGGGDPSKELLSILKTTQPNLNPKELSKKLQENGFAKAAERMNSIDCNSIYNMSIKVSMALCLDLLIEGIHPSIIDLAKSLGIDDRGINAIKKSMLAKGCFSVTDAFFNILSQERPEVTVACIMEALNTICPAAFQEFANLLYEKASNSNE